MRELNIDFLEKYKSIDLFVRDAFGTEDGITEYIRRMEQEQWRGPKYIRYWDTDYRSLKHMRWVRNKLAHEVGYDSDICEASDFEWLKAFGKRLYDGTDPLALLRKLEIKVRQKRAEALKRNKAAGRKEPAAKTSEKKETVRKAPNTGSGSAVVSRQGTSQTKTADDKKAREPQREELTSWQKFKKFFADL